ncbi:hypothetical protein AC579_8269 [Pseudocercospora musae]|uniref:Uncharacterized protein n=1 Tax=Pseudocercospora musae TaxID=113226 RepID=A0A139IVQ0_9PEZI|nr:hypothetical protein AC579_8269 [Pseudocercospora musae]
MFATAPKVQNSSENINGERAPSDVISCYGSFEFMKLDKDSLTTQLATCGGGMPLSLIESCGPSVVQEPHRTSEVCEYGE